jgi:uncharacterized Zn-binding protein involved in type VI secretion
MGQPAARVGDTTAHGIPLTGTGCATVLIGSRPAWRAITPAKPAGAADVLQVITALQSSKATNDSKIEAAVAATAAATLSGLPAAIATAKSAEQTVKGLASTEMSALIASTASSVAVAGGGPPDIHVCTIPLPIPPHGPALVTSGSASVFIGGFAAARVNDPVMDAVGPPNSITAGEATVLIG